MLYFILFYLADMLCHPPTCKIMFAIHIITSPFFMQFFLLFSYKWNKTEMYDVSSAVFLQNGCFVSTQSENPHLISWQAMCCSPSTSNNFLSSCKRRMVICLKFHLIYAAVEAELTFNTILVFHLCPSLQLLDSTKMFWMVLVLLQLSSHNIRVNLWPWSTAMVN